MNSFNILESTEYPHIYCVPFVGVGWPGDFPIEMVHDFSEGAAILRRSISNLAAPLSWIYHPQFAIASTTVFIHNLSWITSTCYGLISPRYGRVRVSKMQRVPLDRISDFTKINENVLEICNVIFFIEI